MTEPPQSVPPLAELPPMPSQHAATKPRLGGVNRVLGSTSGSTAGNTRALLSVGVMVGIMLTLGYLLVMDFSFGVTRADALVGHILEFVLGAGAIIIGMYFGVRSKETGG